MLAYPEYLCKDTNKRARNMKFTSIFFKASAVYLRGLPQRYKQTSEKYEVYFNIFQSECSVSSRFTSEIQTNEREISSLLQYFSKRQAQRCSLKTNSNPPSTERRADMVPPCNATAFFTIASPKPVPPSLRLRPLSTR